MYRRGGRVAEGDGLLNRYTAKIVSRVRIPLLPVINLVISVYIDILCSEFMTCMMLCYVSGYISDTCDDY